MNDQQVVLQLQSFPGPTPQYGGHSPSPKPLRSKDRNYAVFHPLEESWYLTVCAFLQVLCVIFLGLVVLFTELFARPFQRGFFCDDDTIRYPLSANTVSTLTLVAVCFLAPMFVFFGVEGFRLFDASTPRDCWQSVSSTLLKNLYEMYGVFMFGAGLNQVSVDVGKYTIGRLRPHFLDACKPNELTCADNHVYVTDYQCTGDEDAIAEARLSFPSGHAALAFYTAVFMSIFLQHRLHWRSAHLPRHLGQAFVLLMAWFTALSRVRDYMHHPTDVLAGVVIGTIWALVMTSYVIDMSLDSSNATKEELRSLRTTPVHLQGSNNV